MAQRKIKWKGLLFLTIAVGVGVYFHEQILKLWNDKVKPLYSK